MGKVVFLVLLALALLWWFSARKRSGTRGAAPPPARPAGAEAMVRCVHCGVHLPRGEALLDGELAFCSETHRRAGPQAGGPR